MAERLFIELYLDECVDVLLATLLRARGFAVTTTQEAGLIGKDDDTLLAYAASRQSTLFTHNRVDFESLTQRYFIAGKTHAGIIIAVRRPPYELARRVLTILNHVTADEMQDQVRYV